MNLNSAILFKPISTFWHNNHIFLIYTNDMYLVYLVIRTTKVINIFINIDIISLMNALIISNSFLRNTTPSKEWCKIFLNSLFFKYIDCNCKFSSCLFDIYCDISKMFTCLSNLSVCIFFKCVGFCSLVLIIVIKKGISIRIVLECLIQWLW